ncbi:TetR/AcrR family transcriptional regulator [soil metagenome]
MARPSHRDKLLTEGMRVVHRRGFGGASVRDIVQAAGVPQGSFTNHFASKEAFGLEVLDLYFVASLDTLHATLGNVERKPLDRLRDYIDAHVDSLVEDGMSNGCLFGNLCAEANDASEAIRVRLVEIFAHIEHEIADCLRAARKAGQLAPRANVDELAAFIVSGLQGSMLLAKTNLSAQPMRTFERLLFKSVLVAPRHHA